MIQFTQKLVGKKFLHCSPNIENGLDCFTLCIEFLKMKGAVFAKDTVYKGLPIFDYVDIYAKDPFKTMNLAAEYLSTIMKPIKAGYEIAGDILVMRLKKRKNDPINLGINAGNQHIITAVRNKDIRVIAKKYFQIEKALRWE